MNTSQHVYDFYGRIIGRIQSDDYWTIAYDFYGRIIAQGTHRELMRERGYYYDLYTRQYEDLVWQS